MAFIPMPAELSMHPFAVSVASITITWDRPDDFYLIDTDVLPGDDNPIALPPTRPFEVTGQHRDGGVTYATLSFKKRGHGSWVDAFIARREVILSLNVDGALEPLRVKLSRG